MKERLKKELELALFVFLLITVTYIAFYFIDIVRHPSITGMAVYTTETNYKNYTFTNSSLYLFNESLINLSNGARLKQVYFYYNLTNQTTNETISLFNITYPESAVIDTLDFTPSNLNSWGILNKNEILNDQNIIYYYSVDSQNWSLINDFNLSNISSAKISFRVSLISNTTETPFINYLTLFYLTNLSCIEDWQCTDWSSCYENGTQARTCADNNLCGSEDDKPVAVQSCAYIPICQPNWTKLYQECLINDTRLMYYNDTSQCNNYSSLPSDNNTYISCDYCVSNWTCSSYGSCIDDEKECLAVVDENNCYNFSNSTSHNYTGDYSEFTIECNATESSSVSEGEGGSEEPAASSAESASSQEAKLSSECSYDISLDLPFISLIEQKYFKADIHNTGCKLDKLSFSLSPEFNDILKLSEYEITDLEKDTFHTLNLSTNPVLTRNKPDLLIQGFAAKTIQKQIKNITGSIIIKGNIGEEIKIDKAIQITAAVILFDKIELEKKSPLFILILLGLLIAITIVYLTTKYNFRFNIK